MCWTPEDGKCPVFSSYSVYSIQYSVFSSPTVCKFPFNVDGKTYSRCMDVEGVKDGICMTQENKDGIEFAMCNPTHNGLDTKKGQTFYDECHDGEKNSNNYI